MKKRTTESPHREIIPVEQSNRTERDQIRILARKAAARQRDLLRGVRQKHLPASKTPF